MKLNLTINNKLKISFVVYAIVPILLAALSMLIITMAQKNSLEKSYGIEIDGWTEVYNTTILLDKISESAISEVRRAIDAGTNMLENEEYLQLIDYRLQDKYSFILTTKAGSIQYCSEDISSEFLNMLPSFSEIGNGKMKSYNITGEQQYLIKAEKFQYEDGTIGVVYIISRTGVQIQEVKFVLAEVVLILVLIMLLVGIILTLWLHRSIVRPLNSIKRATERIADGNLDFTVNKINNDEFGDLSDSFEIMREKLKESIENNILYDKESKELVSNISHDLKTPITTIKGYVEGLLDGVADTPEKRNKYLKTIYNKSIDMDRLIGELTIYSKIDTNKIPYNFVKMNIDSFFTGIYEETMIEFEQTDMEITYENTLDKETKVMADSEQMRRVLNNIIGNSVKYIDKPNGKVDIKVSDEREFVHIAISDNGKGIEKKDLPFIFDRFYRTDASRNSTKGGSGIGLAIVKKIIEAHNGRIWAESEVEIGTTIHFTLKKAE